MDLRFFWAVWVGRVAIWFVGRLPGIPILGVLVQRGCGTVWVDVRFGCCALRFGWVLVGLDSGVEWMSFRRWWFLLGFSGFGLLVNLSWF